MEQVVFHADSGEAIPSRKGDAYTLHQSSSTGAHLPDSIGNAECPRLDINGLRCLPHSSTRPMKKPTLPDPRVLLVGRLKLDQ